MRCFVPASVVVFLSACGPATNTQQQIILQRATAADAMVDELRALNPTTFARMPTTGSAQFNGYSAVLIDPIFLADFDDIAMLGDVTIDVTFAGAGTVTGTADNFDAVVGDGPTARLAPVTGSLSIGNVDSAIGDGRPANEWDANYGGLLTVDGETYLISGTLEGGFLGNRTSQPAPETIIKGIAGLDGDGTARLSGGGFAPVVFEVLGTNPP